VLLRVVNGRMPAESLDDVRASIVEHLLPVALRRPGLDRFLVGSRRLPDAPDDLAIAFMTVWRDLDSAMAALGGQPTALRLMTGLDPRVTLDHVDFYEVDIVDEHRNDGRPSYLRLTAGTVSRGLDADIQRELRTRLPRLGSEVVDAYIGRRVIESSVQIAFVSTWTADVERRTLEQPVWPDISAQYETFWLELFDVLIEATPGS
jgi:hypothetical protein